MTLLILTTILLIVFLTMALMHPNKSESKCYSKAVYLTSLVLIIYGVLTWFGVPA